MSLSLPPLCHDVGKYIVLLSAAPDSGMPSRWTMTAQSPPAMGMPTDSAPGIHHRARLRGASLALKVALSENVIQRPRLFIAGCTLSQTGGHTDHRDGHTTRPANKCYGAIGRVCDGVDRCLQSARDELRCEADFLSIMTGAGPRCVLSRRGQDDLLGRCGEEDVRHRACVHA